jgi:hypothetical protein
VIYDELSLLDAPKWCTGFSQNPVLKHLLEHPFFFRHKIQRIIQARKFIPVHFVDPVIGSSVRLFPDARHTE